MSVISHRGASLYSVLVSLKEFCAGLDAPGDVPIYGNQSPDPIETICFAHMVDTLLLIDLDGLQLVY